MAEIRFREVEEICRAASLQAEAILHEDIQSDKELCDIDHYRHQEG